MANPAITTLTAAATTNAASATIRGSGKRAATSLFDSISSAASVATGTFGSLGALAEGLEEKAKTYSADMKLKARITAATSKHRMVQKAAIELQEFNLEMSQRIVDQQQYDAALAIINEAIA